MSAAPALDPAAEIVDAGRFQALTGASEAQLARLIRYEAMLRRWQQRINLVGRGSLEELWQRHMLDSAQLVPLLPDHARTLVDLGSGAGFPGMVLAILTGLEVHLVESDQRKAAFLREVSRETSTDVTIHARRIEEMPPLRADVVTARALAPLPRLLALARPLAAPGGVLLFPKGRDARQELADLGDPAGLEIDCLPSRTDPSGTILRLRERSGD